MQSQAYITQEQEAGAHNYHPPPVVVREAEGSWVTDVRSALFGLPQRLLGPQLRHRHPRLIGAAHRQLDRLTLTSRAIHS